MSVNETALFQRLDRMIFLMEKAAKQPSVLIKALNLAATIIGIFGIFAAIDIIKNWLGG